MHRFVWLSILICLAIVGIARADDAVVIPKQELMQFLGGYEKDQKICNLRSRQIKDLKQLTVMQAEQVKKMEEIEKARMEMAQLDDEYRRSLETKNEELKNSVRTNQYWMLGEAIVIVVLLFFVR